MNTLTAIIHRIKTALFGSATNSRTAGPAPVRVKLAGRNGYGNDDIPPPRP
jgi:hypothetical protein